MTSRLVRAAGLTAGLLCLASLLPGSAAAAPSSGAERIDPDAGATTVRGHCLGGGRVKVTVRALTGAGTIPVEVTVRNVPDGSTWRGRISAESYRGGQHATTRFADVVAESGGWSYSTEIDPVGMHTAFGVTTHSVGGERSCALDVYPVLPIQGAVSFCRPRMLAVVVLRRRDDGDLGVRFLAIQLKRVPTERWAVGFKVSGPGGSQQVTVQTRANEEILRAAAVLEGFDDPRVFVSATDANGRTCSMGINVGEVTSAALPSRTTLLHKLRAMSHRAT